MSKEMIVSAVPHETKVALVEEGQVVEVYVEREREVGLVGSIYKGRVTRVLPGMQSAFIDIGLERDAFLYVSDFFEDLEEYERITVADVEEPPQESEPSTPAPPQEARAAAEPQPLDKERQPALRSDEPPLSLPERRPRGRGRRRGGRPRRRGGRPRPDRDRHPRRGYPPQQESTPAEALEPVVLPGESLAKYRDRTSQVRPEGAQAPVEQPEGPGELSADVPVAAPRPQPQSVSDRPGESAEDLAPPSREEPLPTGAVSRDRVPLPAPEVQPIGPSAPVVPEAPAGEGPAPPEAASASEELPRASEPGLESSASTPSEQETGASQPLAESYPDAVTLAELQRVREYQDQVGLPPSVQQRTAGGVEWERHRKGDGRRGPRRRRALSQRGRRSPRRRPRPRGARERRPFHARPSRGQPPIAELLNPGQEIIVQIAKEQMGKKGARITSHVTLPGRFLVYMPTIEHIGISRRIGTSEERSRLRRLLLELKGTITGGFVVRTAATGCREEDLRQDIEYLVKLWHDIRVRAEGAPAPLLLHRDLNLVQRLLRDHFTPDYESLWIESEEEYAKVVEFIGRFQPALARRIKLYTKATPIFEEMGVQQEIDRALRPKVWLKSGGYIVLNQTEALVAVDVNTGKFVGKGSTRLEDTIVKTNLEAVQEIVRQIRLRDLGGIIVIDFIDMEDSRNRHRVMRALEEALRSDRSPSKLLSFNEFGLVAITRKRSRQSLERVLCQPCPTCTGTGMVKSVQTLCYEIQAEARKMAGEIDAPELTIRAHPEIVKALKVSQQGLVRELEEQLGKNIILQSDNGLHIEEYNIY